MFPGLANSAQERQQQLQQAGLKEQETLEELSQLLYT